MSVTPWTCSGAAFSEAEEFHRLCVDLLSILLIWVSSCKVFGTMQTNVFLCQLNMFN